VFYTRTDIEYRAGTGVAILPAFAAIDKVADEPTERRTRLAAEQSLDQILADSFPASDPPSWNPGIALVEPRLAMEPHAEGSEAFTDTDAASRASDIIDVSQPSRANRRLLRGLVSFAGAAGIALLVPFVILVIGLPIALFVRGVLELLSRLFGVVMS
jgi:hypothetical protein